MTQNKQTLKNERQKKREVIMEKRYLNAQKNCYKAINTARISFV